MLDWPKVKALPWRERNAAIEAVVRAIMQKLAGEFRTAEVASLLGDPCCSREQTKLAQILTRMAPRMGPLATHDGEATRSGGRRWRWHGQRKD